MHKSFLFASILTAIVALPALYSLLRRRRRRRISLLLRVLGTVAILFAAGCVFAGLDYLALEYVFNLGPDDMGVQSFAAKAVAQQAGIPVKEVRLVDYTANGSVYAVGYLLTDGQYGVVLCQYDLDSGHFTTATLQPIN